MTQPVPPARPGLWTAAHGASGSHIVDVTDDDRGERVEIFFE